MNVLASIGVVALLALCCLFTVVAASISISEKGWSGKLSSVSWVFLLIAGGLWVLFFWLQPFTLALKGSQ